MPIPLYQSFFSPAYLRYANLRLTTEQTLRDVDFLESRVGLRPASAILDLCCGHGRHAIEFGRKGHLVTGIDLSMLALDEAHRQADTAGVPIRLVNADMRAIPFKEEFDLCYNWFTSFGYFESDEDHSAALRSVRQSLKPGGHFVLDLINLAWLIRNFAPRTWTAGPDGELFLETADLDLVTSRLQFRIDSILPSGSRTSSEISIRLFSLVELLGLLKMAGFTINQVTGGGDSEPLTLLSPRMIVFAKVQ